MGEIMKCDCCRADTTVKHYESDPESDAYAYGDKLRLLCKICASTHAGIWHEYYRTKSEDTLALMKMIAFVGNEILTKIETIQAKLEIPPEDR
jgi:hypothetical protein